MDNIMDIINLLNTKQRNQKDLYSVIAGRMGDHVKNGVPFNYELAGTVDGIDYLRQTDCDDSMIAIALDDQLAQYTNFSELQDMCNGFEQVVHNGVITSAYKVKSEKRAVAH